MPLAADPRPVVVHVMFRFDTGGLENGVVNLINHLPANAYRHVVLSLTEVTDFCKRVQRPDVEFIALHKPPGHAVWQYPKLFKIFRQLRPAIVHTNNLAALECSVPAWAAGVPARIHSEHGWDVTDLDGSNLRYQRIRKLYRHFVTHYVSVSGSLHNYLLEKVHVPPQRASLIYNGVDVARFYPAAAGPEVIAGCPFTPDKHWLIGTVGRIQPVKDHANLLRSFAIAIQEHAELANRLRLAIVGDGPLRAQMQTLAGELGISDRVWMPGERSDVPNVMRGLHCFTLPSLSEGISYTLLEAMASGLPVVATDVGGNGELVQTNRTGLMVPPANPQALSRALVEVASDPAQARQMGNAGRKFVEARFSQKAMLSAYQRVYDQQLGAR